MQREVAESHIHLQEDQYLGRFQARWYRTLRGEMIDGEMMWKESAVTHMNLKSFIARVTKAGSQYKVLGVVLNDGTPMKSVEVKVDDGPWQPATLDPATQRRNTPGSCSPTPGTARRPASTRSSRASPTSTARCSRRRRICETKKSFLEENSQVPRKVTI